MDYRIINADCAEVLPDYAGQVNLVVTSPPYGALRDYGGHGFDFDRVAEPLARCLAPGGVLVWVVADATVDGSETGDSFRQALAFKDLGLKLHDTMIYRKAGSGGRTWNNRHPSGFEFMFIFSRGKPNTVNIICDHPAKWHGKRENPYTLRSAAGNTQLRGGKTIPAFCPRDNVWEYKQGWHMSALDFPDAHQHPAIFPYALAYDHIQTWTNPGDLVVDPMAGSGTTLRAAVDSGRRAVGIEIHNPYCELIERRMAQRVLELA